MIHVRLSGNAKCAKTVPIGKLKIQYPYIHTNTDRYRQHASQSSCILNNPNNSNRAILDLSFRAGHSAHRPLPLVLSEIAFDATQNDPPIKPPISPVNQHPQSLRR